MNPALARRLGIAPNRGLKLDEVSYLLYGQRTDGRAIEGKRHKKDAPPVGEVFGLDSAVRPSRAQLERILAGQTIDGIALPAAQSTHAVRRFTRAMGAKAPKISQEQREHILAGRMADGKALSDREYKAVLEQGASRIGYIDFTFSAPNRFRSPGPSPRPTPSAPCCTRRIAMPSRASCKRSRKRSAGSKRQWRQEWL